MKSLNLKSGNTLQVQEASFNDAWNLTQAIAAELGKSMPGLKIDSLDAEALQKDIDIGKLFGIVLQLIASKAVAELVWECLKPCLYNDQKIDRNTFSDPRARPDFLPAVVEIVKLNVLPFMKGLDLSSMTGQPLKVSDQK